MFDIMAFKITDTGKGIRLMVKNSLIDLTYVGARTLANAINKAIDAQKERRDKK